jgi:hypothetical protein
MPNRDSIFFTPHNRAWNNRTAVMTHEVWLMLVGLNLDFWSEQLLDKVVSSFGRLLLWQEDMFHMSRTVIRVRVSNLEDIPWFFVFSEGTQFESNSWCVQCEILQTTMLGIPPQDEDLPPNDGDFNPNNFHFQGFGQPVNQMPPPAPIVHQFNPNQGLLNHPGFQALPQDGEDDHIPLLIPLQDEVLDNNLVEPQEEILQSRTSRNMSWLWMI